MMALAESRSSEPATPAPPSPPFTSSPSSPTGPLAPSLFILLTGGGTIPEEDPEDVTAIYKYKIKDMQKQKAVLLCTWSRGHGEDWLNNFRREYTVLLPKI